MKTDIMNTELHEIADEFGITLLKKDAACVSNLNVIPERIQQVLARIDDTYGKILFLEYCTTSENHKYLRQFVHLILLEGKDPACWKIGRSLKPDTSLENQLTKSLFEIFGELETKICLIEEPQKKMWNEVGETGCFVIKQEDARYTWESVNGFMTYSLDIPVREIRKEEIPTYHRRWIANRIARCLKVDGLLDSFSDISVLDRYTSRDKLTADAIKAFEGLLKEQKEFGWKEDEVPGYVGPDEFYE